PVLGPAIYRLAGAARSRVAHHLEPRATAAVDPHAVAALAPAAALHAGRIRPALDETGDAVDRHLAFAILTLDRGTAELEVVDRRAAAPAEAVQVDVAAAGLDEAGAVEQAAALVARLDVELPAVPELPEIAGRHHVV